MRIVKRSSSASGNGYVPSYSIGFWVAITMNGRTSSYVLPSTVTWFSCMHSSSAAWVFGDARLISSTSRRFANTGPGRNSNSLSRWLKTFTPVTSDGSRSGVNWSRENEQSIERASAFASIVFPTPGKSSMIRWPSASRESTQRRSVSADVWTTRARFSTIRPTARAAASASARSLPTASSTALREARDFVQDRACDPLLRRLRDPALLAVEDEHDLVVGRLEADVLARDVVVDNEVDVLALELLACAREPALACVRRKADEHLAVSPAGTEISEHVHRRF